MGMLKSGSSVLSFDQLMAQATMVAKRQDAHLLERARQKRREDEEKKRKEENVLKEKREAQQLLEKKRELQEKKQKNFIEQRKQQKRTEKFTKPRPQSKASSHSLVTPEKKKPVHMSFEDLMKKAKEQSSTKKDSQQSSIPTEKKTPGISPTSRSSTTPNLYNRTKRPDAKSSQDSRDDSSNLSVREKAKLLAAEPPRKIVGHKKDKRSIDDVQREIRHAKGIYSDDEDIRKKDPRLMANKNRQTQRYQLSDMPVRKRPISPPVRAAPRKPEISRRIPTAPIPRMPFTGRSLDRNFNKPQPTRRYREEEEYDEELDSFIVDDEEEDDYYRGPRKNSYSDVIGKIFRYDRNKYSNEPIYSDDDMEADARDVLKEEKRSERLAKREDLIEEQKELERLKRRKKNFA
ncbi:SPT2 chromatin protein-domain-containing protein [Sporodiniella umbellata]|nr:SPT2 chromatin protein-domain-containing protein [Sporodiniella umbellata]